MGFISNAIGGLSKAFTAQNDFGADNAGQDYQNLLASGQGNIDQVYGQQQGLAQALQAQANGYGPNPAQAMLNNATQQNIQSAAGLAASQKGLNPAMAARVAAQSGAAANQQAAGQGAAMGAQQQLGAQSALGGLYGQMGNQQIQNQSMLQNALANKNKIGAEIAEGNSGRQQTATSGLLAMAGQGMAMAGGGKGGGNGMYDGGAVPGKAEHEGNTPENDTVPAMLSPGEIVIPRSHADTPEDAKSFVEALMKNGKGKNGASSYAKIVAAHKKYQEELALLHAKRGG